jgi:hypothetical protein
MKTRGTQDSIQACQGKRIITARGVKSAHLEVVVTISKELLFCTHRHVAWLAWGCELISNTIYRPF